MQGQEANDMAMNKATKQVSALVVETKEALAEAELNCPDNPGADYWLARAQVIATLAMVVEEDQRITLDTIIELHGAGGGMTFFPLRNVAWVDARSDGSVAGVYLAGKEMPVYLRDDQAAQFLGIYRKLAHVSIE